MASPFQQQSLRRKIVYTVLILALFTATLVLRQMNVYGIDAQARKLEIHEESFGEVELAGSAMRLSLTGMRGVAVCGLWWAATEKQKKNQWNELELLVRSVTKLQPHFITPWLFQSWNLAYNVSVESDRIRDKYFYITRGIELLAEGERQNRENPDLRFSMGFYNQHKIGLSDEANTFRCLFEMSCMDPIDRDAERMRMKDANGNSVVDLNKFEQFCRKHPMLVRRLREALKKNTPADILDFLADNQKIPSRYEDRRGTSIGPDERTPLKPLDQQFPLLAADDPQHLREVAKPERVDFDNFMVARDWYSYAVEPMPPPMGELGPSYLFSYDTKRYRMPRYMAPQIFRGYPARGQTYVAEFLEKEGWFDAEGWKITGGWFNDDKFPSDSRDAVVGDGTAWGREAWDTAYKMWEKHGIANGMYLTPEQIKDLKDRALVFEKKFGVQPGDRMVGLPIGETDPALREGFKAHVQLAWFDHVRNMTNYPYFYFRSQVEAEPAAVTARKTLFQAEQLRKAGDRQLAMAKYSEAFPKWRDLMLDHPSFSHDQTQQEDIYEFVLHYLDLVHETYGKRLKELLLAGDFLVQSANRPPVPVAWLPPASLPPQIRANVTTALDGVDREGKPLIDNAAIQTVRSRLHLPTIQPRMPEMGPATPASPELR